MSRKPTEIDPHEVDAYLARCWDRATAPRVSEFACELGISRVTLNLRFQEKMGTSLSEYFAAKRDKAATTLLVESSLKTEDVAVKAGFGTPRTFHRAFARKFGVSPARYRTLSKMSGD
ncbi:MAG TPA: AraC family transcriptional regulator [Thermoanaerobaculia bacterium]|nr:AraC family transcriptional regulator [Thermoanaerobaculia bacterium]